MNYDTAWFFGLLDRIAFSPQPNRPRVRFQSGTIAVFIYA